MDSFSSVTIISEKLRHELRLHLEPPDSQLHAVGGEELTVVGIAECSLFVQECKQVRVRAYVIPKLFNQIDILLGHDVHGKMGSGLMWNFAKNQMRYVAAVTAEAVTEIKEEDNDHEEKISPPMPSTVVPLGMEDHGNEEKISPSMPGTVVPLGRLITDEPDFKLSFSGERWIVSNKWIDGQPPPRNRSQFKTQSVFYKKPWFTEDQLADLVSEWVNTGILRPIEEEDVKFVIPLNPVKGGEGKTTKIRLAMDYKELNKYIVCVSSVDTNEDCSQQLRAWRLRGNGQVIDLSKAYLSIGLDPAEQPYHCVKFRGSYFCMTRLAFGVSNGGRVLFRALENVLEQHDILSYRDDLLVDMELVGEISKKLTSNGFNIKPPEDIGPGVEATRPVRVLGLNVQGNQWIRVEQNANDWRLFDDSSVTLAQLSGWINSVTAVSPIQGWLRPIGVAIKSRIGQLAQKQRWNQRVWDEYVLELYERTRQRLRAGDNPMQGQFAVPRSGHWTLFSDASKDVQGGILLKNGTVIEDYAAKSPEHLHINVKELNAVISGIQLLKKYDPEPTQKLVIFCDNKAVIGWLQAMMRKDPIRSRAMYSELVKTRLVIIAEMVAGMQLEVKYVKSSENLADALTRVMLWPSTVQKTKKNVGALTAGSDYHLTPIPRTRSYWRENSGDFEACLLKAHHEMLHPSKYQLKLTIEKEFPEWDMTIVSRSLERITAECDICAKKMAKRYPGSVGYGKSFESSSVGEVIFLDVFKVDGISFTNIIDGYSRFTIPLWTEGSPNANSTRDALLKWFAIFGTPRVVRCDRGSENNQLHRMAEEFQFTVRKGSVQHPQSQSLVERFHRSILSLIRCQEDLALRTSEKFLKALFVYLRRPHASLYGHSPLEVIHKRIDLQSEGRERDTEADQDDETFVDEDIDNTNIETHLPRFEIDEVILWYDRDQKKSKFPWRRGRVVEIYDKGGYLVRFDDTNRTRTVNEESMVNDPSAVAASPLVDSDATTVLPAVQSREMDSQPYANFDPGYTDVGMSTEGPQPPSTRQARDTRVTPPNTSNGELDEYMSAESENRETPDTLTALARSTRNSPASPIVETSPRRSQRNIRPPKRFGYED